MILITSKKINFRRCGVAHPKEPTEYPDGRFSEEELDILFHEPMLSVEVEIVQTNPITLAKAEAKAEARAEARAKAEAEGVTVPVLKELLDKFEVLYDAKARKAELFELVMKNTAEQAESF